MPLKSSKSEIVFPVLLGLLTILFFFDTLFLDNVFSFRDFYRYFYPYKKFATEWLRSGIFPLWNPLSSCGAPFFAGLQSQVAYPLSLIHYCLPFNFGLNLFVAVHYFLAGLFVYLLCIDLELRKYSAFLGALIFAFSGYLLSLVDLLSTLSSVTWLPLIVLVYLRTLRLEWGNIFLKVFYLILSSIVLGIMLLGGEPTVCYGTCALLLLLTLVSYDKEKSWLVLLLVLSLTVLLTAFQLLPFIEYIKYSDRGMQSKDLTRQLNMLWSLPPEQLLGFVIPWFAGDITKNNVDWYAMEQMWLKSAYTGIVPAVLFILGIFFVKKEKGFKKRLLVSLYFAALLSVLLAIGKYNMFYEQFYNYIPGFGLIRFPVKFIFIAVFSFSLLSAYAFDKLVEKYSKNIRQGKAALPVLFFTAAILIGLLLLFVFKKQLLHIDLRFFHPGAEISELIYCIGRFKVMFGLLINSSLLLICASVLLLLYIRKKVAKKIFLSLFLLLVYADLFINNYCINPVLPSKIYTGKLATAAFLMNNQRDSRNFLFLKDQQATFLFGESYSAAMYKAQLVIYPNQNMLYDLNYFNSYDSLNTKIYAENYTRLIKTTRARFLDMMSIKYVVTLEELRTPFLYKKKDYGGINIYENPGCLPRCYPAFKTKVFGDSRSAAKYIESAKFNPHLETVIESSDGLFDINNPASGKVLIKETNPNKVLIGAVFSNPGIVVLTDTYFPGWQARVDGKKTGLLKVNGMYRGVLCGAGVHKILFEYRPDSLRTGVAVTTATILGVFLTLILLYNRNLYGRETQTGYRKRDKAVIK